MKRLDRIFEAHETTLSDGRRIRSGQIIRQAWRDENAISDALAAEIARLLDNALHYSDLTTYADPGCCSYHQDIKRASFSHSTYGPDDRELLALVSELIWTVVPQARGVQKMVAPKSTQRDASRFMPLEAFLDRHDSDVMSGAKAKPLAVREYFHYYSATRPKQLRRSHLKAELDRRVLKGNIGAFAIRSPRAPGSARYCSDCQPFATLREVAKPLEHVGTGPDTVLGRLGLQFPRDKIFIELVYRVTMDPCPTPSPPHASAPTVLDAKAYWLFRPDRESDGASGPIWNYTRDVVTDRRGVKELISGPAAISQLRDLIVWPKATLANWDAIAASSLTADILAS